MTDDFKAAVGLGRQWEPKKAGREVATDLMQQMGDKKPNFVLLFSTIHYADKGGFQRLLDSIYDILPEGIPLIGCTFAGFMTNRGVFTRGCCLYGISYPNIDIAIGIGHNTKRNPKNAGKVCGRQIKEKLANSKYNTKVAFFFPSAAVTPQFPVIGSKRVIRFRNKKLNSIVSIGVSWVNDLLRMMIQKGIGMEEDILREFVSELPEFMLIGGAAMDDNKMARNFQFYNKKVHTNSVVALGMRTDLKSSIKTTYGLNKVETAPECRVTKRRSDGYTIHKINGKSPADEYLAMTGGGEYWFDNRIHRRTFFLPMGYTIDGVLYPQVVAYVMGDDILCGFRVAGDKLGLYTASGRSMKQSVVDNLKRMRNSDNKMLFVASCAARLETLGSKTYDIKEQIEEFSGDLPYVLVFTGGEQTYIPGGRPNFFYETFNALVLNS